MNKDELKKRTKKFALDLINLVNQLPNNRTGNTLGGQLIRSGTSVGANYWAACRARSLKTLNRQHPALHLKSYILYPISQIQNPKSNASLLWFRL